MSTWIIRHRRENLKKCSLRGLENEFQFFRYPIDLLPDVTGVVLLTMEGPILSERDCRQTLLLIDGTWKLAQKIEKQLKGNFIPRALPSHIQTAYPRRQTDCPDPESGLASVEALYIAHCILGRPVKNLLDQYLWKDLFLKKNEDLIKSLRPPILG